MSRWKKADSEEIIDTNNAGITQNGTYYLDDSQHDSQFPVAFCVRVDGSEDTATVQLFSEVAGIKTNIDVALTPTFATPSVRKNDSAITGVPGIIVTGITGRIYPEVSQEPIWLRSR